MKRNYKVKLEPHYSIEELEKIANYIIEKGEFLDREEAREFWAQFSNMLSGRGLTPERTKKRKEILEASL